MEGEYLPETVHIDGFNTIITLEVALSGSHVFCCRDDVLRDLAGLRGTHALDVDPGIMADGVFCPMPQNPADNFC